MTDEQLLFGIFTETQELLRLVNKMWSGAKFQCEEVQELHQHAQRLNCACTELSNRTQARRRAD